MNPDHEESELLSSAATARRREILAEALCAADRRRRGRAIRRAGVVTCVAGVLVGAIVFAPRENDSRISPTPVVIEPPRAPQSKPTSVHNDHQPLRSITPPPRREPKREAKLVVQVISNEDVKPRWQVLSDDQFLAELADAGQPSGLLRLNGQSMIVPIR
jgi:hypothetical protein